MNTIDETEVEAFLADIAQATPRELTRHALNLEVLVRRGSCAPHQGRINMATLSEALRRLRAVLVEEP